MSEPTVNDQSSARTSNVRLVVVDDHRQPRYLLRAMELEKTLIAAAAAFGVEPEDTPGLHGLCIEAVRSAERNSR